MASEIRKYTTEMRIKSWLKNAFVFFPIVFSMELFNWGKLLDTAILAFAFCLVSSSIYVLNDISDVEKDRKHSVKCKRPIAAGDISITKAWILMIGLLVAGLVLSAAVNINAFFLILAYVLINILYSKWLKKKVIIDCFCIAAGFVLRVLVGGTIVSNGVSDWMFLTVVALSLFMAFGKRRGELKSHGDGGTRDVLESYDIRFLDGIIFMCAGLTMVFYSLWSISHTSILVYSVPIVMFIVVRYLLLVFGNSEEADPTTLILKDNILLIACGLCGLLLVGMLYIPQVLLH